MVTILLPLAGTINLSPVILKIVVPLSGFSVDNKVAPSYNLYSEILGSISADVVAVNSVMLAASSTAVNLY